MQGGKVIAELVQSVTQAARDDDEVILADLERRGIIKRGSGEPFPEDFFEPGPPAGQGGTLAALQEERRKRG